VADVPPTTASVAEARRPAAPPSVLLAPDRAAAPAAPSAPAPRPAVQPSGQEILSAKELAAAFQLKGPDEPGRGQGGGGGRSRRGRWVVAVLLLVLIGAAAGYLAYDSAMRDQVLQLGRDGYHSVRDLLTSSKSAGDSAGKSAGAAVQQADGSVQPLPAPSPQPLARQRAGGSPDARRPSHGAPITEGASIEAVGRDATAVRSAQPAMPSPHAQPMPVASDTKATADTKTTPTPPTVDLDAAIAQSRRLYNAALDAEGQGDWAQALRCYQEIQRLPAGAWQGDLKLRLEQAQRRVSGS